MHLLHTYSLRLKKDITPERLPPYAILSHTWADDEVLFSDIENRTASRKAGYGKVTMFCAKAKDEGFEYVWIDTCCIDKSSSAELSEAINSMYTWYQRADRCFVFLADVPSNTEISSDSNFAESRWFQRGWTVQELLAPEWLTFYSRDWTVLCHKHQACELLFEITGIPQAILMGKDLRTCSVAQRMSWASHRETTRPEDMAYSLLSLFSVHMPLIYGEGGKAAFLRLQEEIIKQTDDFSIFAWTAVKAPTKQVLYRGLLAHSPSEFRNSGDIVEFHDRSGRQPFQMTNRGLQVELKVGLDDARNYSSYSYIANACGVAHLQCPCPARIDKSAAWLAILIGRIGDSEDQFARIQPENLVPVDVSGYTQSLQVYVRHDPAPFVPRPICPYNMVVLQGGLGALATHLQTAVNLS